MKWPFRPPHLTLKPFKKKTNQKQTKNKQKRNKKKPKPTKKLKRSFSVISQNFRCLKEMGFPRTKTSRWSRNCHFWTKTKTKNSRSIFGGLFLFEQQTQKMLKPQFLYCFSKVKIVFFLKIELKTGNLKKGAQFHKKTHFYKNGCFLGKNTRW